MNTLGRGLVFSAIVIGGAVGFPKIGKTWCETCGIVKGKQQCERVRVQRRDISGLSQGQFPSKRALFKACAAKFRIANPGAKKVRSSEGLWRAGGYTKRY